MKTKRSKFDGVFTDLESYITDACNSLNYWGLHFDEMNEKYFNINGSIVQSK